MNVATTIKKTRLSPFTIQLNIPSNDAIRLTVNKELFWDNDDNLDFVDNHYMLEFSFDGWNMIIKAEKKGDFNVPNVESIRLSLNSDISEWPSHYIIGENDSNGETVLV